MTLLSGTIILKRKIRAYPTIKDIIHEKSHMNSIDFPQLIGVKSLSFNQFPPPVPAIQAEHDGYLYASLPALCAVFSLDMQQQLEQLHKHYLLNNGLGQITLSDEQPTIMLRVGYMAIWLTHLHLDDLPFIREREEIEQFQREAAQILEEAFYEGRLTQAPFITHLIEGDTIMATIYKEAIAILALTRERLLRVKVAHTP